MTFGHTTVPFLVLARALADTSTKLKKHQAKWVLDTYNVIYKQSGILCEDKNHIKSLENQTIEHVQNNLVFLNHLFCALRCGDISAKDLQERIDKKLIEETIRRRLNKWQEIEIMMKGISKVFGIDQRIYEPVKEFKKKTIQNISKLL